MPVEQFSAVLELCARSGIWEARLLGGEPTLHPRFTTLVDLALARGFRVLCFSGGIVPKPVLAYLEQLSPDRIQLVLNCPPPGRHAPVVYRRQREVMERLGPRISLGLNYDAPGISAEFLLDAIERYGLVRTLRLGLAHPVHGGTNDYLLPCHFREVGARVVQLAARAAATRIGLSFDCGWVPCMFPDIFLAEHENIAQQIGNRCNPILDMLPDGSAISCYSLRRHAALAVAPGTTASDLRTSFSRLQAADRKTGVYRTCEVCRWRAAGQCGGGCLATALLRSRRGTFAFVAAEPQVHEDDLLPRRSNFSQPLMTSCGSRSPSGEPGNCWSVVQERAPMPNPAARFRAAGNLGRAVESGPLPSGGNK